MARKQKQQLTYWQQILETSTQTTTTSPPAEKSKTKRKSPIEIAKLPPTEIGSTDNSNKRKKPSNWNQMSTNEKKKWSDRMRKGGN